MHGTVAIACSRAMNRKRNRARDAADLSEAIATGSFAAYFASKTPFRTAHPMSSRPSVESAETAFLKLSPKGGLQSLSRVTKPPKMWCGGLAGYSPPACLMGRLVLCNFRTLLIFSAADRKSVV